MSGLHRIFPDQFDKCDHCGGKGKVDCSACGGHRYREITRSGYDEYGRYYSRKEQETCTNCHGSGQSQCNYCRGSGDQRKYSREVIDPVTGGAPAVSYEERLSRSNETKAKLLSKISETITDLQPLKLPYPYSQWSGIDPELESRRAANLEQLNKLYTWVNGLDPVNPLTAARVQEIRESWRSYPNVYDWLSSFERDCAWLMWSEDRR